MILVAVVVVAFYAGLAVGYALHVWLLQNPEEGDGCLAGDEVLGLGMVRDQR
jgi:hypothetical protein